MLGKILGMLFLMLLDIFLARKLEVNKYAEWVFFFSTVTMLFFIGWLGINMASKVRVAQCTTKEDRAACLTSAFIMRLLTSVLICPLIALVMSAFCDKLGYPVRYPDLKSLFFMSGLLIFFNSFTEFYKELLMGLENFKSLFFFTVFEYGGYLLFGVVWIFLYDSVLSVAIAYCCTGALIFILGFIMLHRQYGAMRSELYNTSINKKMAKEIFRYALPLFLVGIGAVILIEIDIFMLGVLSDKSEVAVYNIAKGLNSKAAHVNYSIAVGAMTTFSIIEQADLDRKHSEFRKISGINYLVTALISLAMLSFMPFLIQEFYGKEYAAAGMILKILVPYYILYSLSTFFSTFMDFRGIARKRGLAYISVIVLDIVLNYLWIPHKGAVGAALATSVSLIPYTLFVIICSVREWARIRNNGGDNI